MSAVEELLSGLTDGDESTRRYAVEDLGALRDTAVAPALAAALGDESAAVREAAVDALGRLPPERAVEAVVPALRSEEPAVRNAACEVLRAAGAAAAPVLVPLVADADPDVRLFALDVLAGIGGPEAVPAIAAALTDANANIAIAAAGALGGLRAASALGALVGALGPDVWLRCAVAKSLGQIGGPRAVEALCGLLRDADELPAYAAAVALGEVGGANELRAVVAQLAHPSPLVAGAALAAANRITTRLSDDDLTALRGALDLARVLPAPDGLNRGALAAAVRLASRFGATECVPYLVAALRRATGAGHAETARAAAAGLVACGEEGRAALAALTDHADPALRAQ